MSLFKRKTTDEDIARCPDCGERVPVGAEDCAMCGRSLLDGSRPSEDGGSQVTSTSTEARS